MIRIAALVAASVALALPASAQDALRGVALVIGQSDYEHLAPLINPENDARAIDDMLLDLGFEVTRVLDAGAAELTAALDGFAEDAAEADVALIYYSGHGIEAGGENYLIPVDADVSTPQAAGEKLVPLSVLLDKLRASVPVTIFLLDACRTNSFPPGTMVQLPGAAAPVAVSEQGLAETRGGVLTQARADAESVGMVIGFAASPGHAALDGEPDGNSPYAAALLKHFSAGGYEFGDVMTMVTEEVYLETQARQLPWTNTSLRRLLSFGGPVEMADADQALIRDGRRALLLSIASAPTPTRQFVEAVARSEEVPLDALYGMLSVLGVNTSAGTAELEAQLHEGAQQLKQLKEQSAAIYEDDPEIARLSALAAQAEEEGALKAALEFRNRASERAIEVSVSLDDTQVEINERRKGLAATFASNAAAAMTVFDLHLAAERYQMAADEVAFDDSLKYAYLKLKADALSAIGEYHGDNVAFDEAIALYDEVVTYLDTQPDDDTWADAVNNFGIAFARYGERRVDNEYLEDSLRAWGEVLEIWTRDKYPKDWARVQGNVGVSLTSLSDRDGNPNRWIQAIAAFRSALEVWTREETPIEWARAHNNLGSALAALGNYAEDVAGLEQAVDAYRTAMLEWTRERSPFEWAMVQNNLANALGDIGLMTEDPKIMIEGVKAYHAALEVWTRELVPLRWAALQNNLGATLAGIGRYDDRPQVLTDAALAYRNSLMERTKERDPLNWAQTQYNLGLVLTTIAERDAGAVAPLEEAVGAFRAALEVYDAEQFPVDWADAEEGLGWALAMLGQRTGDAAMIAKGRAAIETAYAYYAPQDGAQAYFEEKLAAVDGMAASIR